MHSSRIRTDRTLTIWGVGGGRVVYTCCPPPPAPSHLYTYPVHTPFLSTNAGNVLNFMPLFGKFGNFVCFCSPRTVGAPSWIHPCPAQMHAGIHPLPRGQMNDTHTCENRSLRRGFFRKCHTSTKFYTVLKMVKCLKIWWGGG